MSGPRDGFTFAVVTDTHVRTEPVDPQAGYPSDRLHNARNRAAVDLLRTRRPDFVVHLGDVTHAVPGLETYEACQAVARSIWGALDCPLHVAPGNHDVGDKPDALVAAPPATAAAHRAFAAHWGPPWRAFEHRGCRFVLLDAPVMNSGLELEREQAAWLERTLAQERRTFLFLHYPPFVVEPGEPSHYDNLAGPARGWLLDLLARHRVEALFSGHVHTFSVNRLGETDLYGLPSVAFTRPEYSELHSVGPADENGRNDEWKLGFFLVHARSSGHRVELVRLARRTPAAGPPAPAPVGVCLDEAWARTLDLPVGDLDPFRRKPARDDQVVLALWDAGIERVRLPLGDLERPDLGARARLLAARGMRLVAFTTGVPDEATVARVAQVGRLVDLWEVLAPPGLLAPCAAALAHAPVPTALTAIDADRAGSGYFSHFPRLGFPATSQHPLPALPAAVTHLGFRVTSPDGVAAAARRAAAAGRRALCHVELPRGDERRAHTDDDATARFVVEVAAAARALPEAIVLLDTFTDKDRGYHPRHGLIDRRSNPRPAFEALRRL